MARGEKTKSLWDDPEYRRHMSEAHKWQTPPSRKGTAPNSGSFKKGHGLGLAKPRWSEARRARMREIFRGRIPWNKGRGTLTRERKAARNTEQYRTWREAVYSRDDYTCQKCLVRGGLLHPHHIESFAKTKSLRYDIRNGITLCVKHHNAFHKKYGLRNFTRLDLRKYLNQ